jgi:hypothetical protein
MTCPNMSILLENTEPLAASRAVFRLPKKC